MDEQQYPTIGRILPQPSLRGSVSDTDRLSGNISTDKAVEIPYREVSNFYGTEVYIG